MLFLNCGENGVSIHKFMKKERFLEIYEEKSVQRFMKITKKSSFGRKREGDIQNNSNLQWGYNNNNNNNNKQ